jgi:hypothetical protein
MKSGEIVFLTPERILGSPALDDLETELLSLAREFRGLRTQPLEQVTQRAGHCPDRRGRHHARPLSQHIGPRHAADEVQQRGGHGETEQARAKTAAQPQQEPDQPDGQQGQSGCCRSRRSVLRPGHYNRRPTTSGNGPSSGNYRASGATVNGPSTPWG